jgi:hypothetical protein
MTITRRLRFATLEHGFRPTQCLAPARRPKNDAAAVWQKDGALPSSLAKIVMAASRWATSAWLTGLAVNVRSISSHILRKVSAVRLSVMKRSSPKWGTGPSQCRLVAFEN